MRDLQLGEKSIETVLRACHLLFPEEDFGQSCLSTQVTVLQAGELGGPACLHTQASEGLPGALSPDLPSPLSTEARESPFHTTASFLLLCWCPTPNPRS